VIASNPERSFVTGHHGREQRRTGRAGFLGDGKRRRQHDGAEMPTGMGIVLYAQMKQDGVRKRRLARRHGLAIENAPRAACRRAAVEKPRRACGLLGLGRGQRNGDTV
jgi:hypothetical protein